MTRLLNAQNAVAALGGGLRSLSDMIQELVESHGIDADLEKDIESHCLAVDDLYKKLESAVTTHPVAVEEVQLLCAEACEVAQANDVLVINMTAQPDVATGCSTFKIEGFGFNAPQQWMIGLGLAMLQNCVEVAAGGDKTEALIHTRNVIQFLMAVEEQLAKSSPLIVLPPGVKPN